MRWEGMRESENVEDRRRSGTKMVVGGGLGTLVIIILGLLFGVDPSALLQTQPGSGISVPSAHDGVDQTNDPREDRQAKFSSVVLANTEDVWTKLFSQSGKRYVPPKLVLFRGQVQSACGFASAAVGPFYCPGDSDVYLDLGFFDELAQRFKAPGEFAEAYVVAHEVGHHVQNLLGISDRVHAMRQRMSEKEYNAVSVRMELQADFLAGVWAHHAQKMNNILEPGDIESGLRAASAIGDDKIQMQSRGYVVPDSFTHGSSAQRVKWFRRGFDTGDMKYGDTFNSPDP